MIQRKFLNPALQKRWVNREKPIRDLHWTIMHLFYPSDVALKVMANIGIMATLQDHPVLLAHNQRRWWGDEHAAYAIPIRKTIAKRASWSAAAPMDVVDDDATVLKGYALGK